MIRLFVTVLGVLALAVGAAGLASRYLPVTNEVVLIVAAAAPYLAVAGVIAMILLALARRWVLTILAAVLFVVSIGVQLPRFIGPEQTGTPSVAVRVVTANLGFGRADPAVTDSGATDSADVLVTPGDDAGHSRRDVGCGSGRRVPAPRARASPDRRQEIGVWSRYPIVIVRAHRRLSDADAEHADSGPRRDVLDPTVLAVHLAAPWVQPLDDFTT